MNLQLLDPALTRYIAWLLAAGSASLFASAALSIVKALHLWFIGSRCECLEEEDGD